VAVIDVGDQKVQCGIHAGQVFTGDTGLHVFIGAHAKEYGIVFIEQLLEGDVLADLGIESEFDTHTFEDLAAVFDHLFFQLEFGNAEGQQAADLGITVIDHGLDAVAGQYIGTTDTGRTGTDHGHSLTGIVYLGQVRLPALGKGCFRDICFDGADGDGTKAVIQGTGPFTQSVLRADPATDLGQGIGAMGQLSGLKDIAFGDQFQPVGNIVVYRAAPFTIGIAAFQTTLGLLSGGGSIEGAVDLTVFPGAFFDRLFLRVVTLELYKLKVIRHV